MLTREHLSAELVELVPSLAKTRAPAKIFDKRTYSPWIQGGLHASLVLEELETLVITGCETMSASRPQCWEQSILGIELSCYPTVYAVEDGTHDASLKLLGDRFSVQLALQTTDEFLRNVIV